ncbi:MULTISPECIES: hypothetical protein [Methylobacterium]|uniref:hypothetical protein n=1 Tax=Methylobacterium TaxID=407 RepID=UPI0013EDBC26|nr:hypothetical protein [Methylobacterium sp. DB0501]NGM34657.1 hypothetical protein [Methylobacterium sp. DB0501]
MAGLLLPDPDQPTHAAEWAAAMRGTARVLTEECVELYALLLRDAPADRREVAGRLRALEAALGNAAGPLGLHAWWDVAEPVQAEFPGLLDG